MMVGAVSDGVERRRERVAAGRAGGGERILDCG